VAAPDLLSERLKTFAEQRCLVIRFLANEHAKLLSLRHDRSEGDGTSSPDRTPFLRPRCSPTSAC